jgi:hypothetical protein
MGPVQGEHAWVPSVGAREKEPVIDPVHELGPSEPPPEVIPEDGLVRVLLRVDCPPHVDDFHLVPLRLRIE